MIDGEEHSQKLDQSRIKKTITEDRHAALRTRSCRQQTAPVRMIDDASDDRDLFQATHQDRNKDKDLIR